MNLRHTMLALAAAMPLFAGGAQAQPAQPTFADYCNDYAADAAAGRDNGAYDVGREDVYLAAYKDCMKAHHTLWPIALQFLDRDLGVVEEHLEASDRDAYCAAKYRSYDPRTGMYRTYSGDLKPCR